MKQIACLSALALAVAASTLPARAGTEDEVRATFEKFVAAQNAHDPVALRELLSDSQQFLWITRGVPIWGRDATVQRFSVAYQGTWKLDPDWSALRVMTLSSDAAHLMVPITFTVGDAGQPPAQTRMFINQILVKTPAGWRVTSILPVPAAPPAK